jgi:hypothetical protein
VRVSGEIIGEALAYWRQLRGGRPMPRRADIDPVDIPKLLPFVMLVDVLEQPLDFRFRLIGTEIAYILSRNLHNTRFSANPDLAAGNGVWAEYVAVVETHVPVVGAISYVGGDPCVRSLRHGLMPLSADGTQVNMIFVAVEIGRR